MKIKDWLRYLAIRAKAVITWTTVVSMFGNTYIVYNGTVQYVGRNTGW